MDVAFQVHWVIDEYEFLAITGVWWNQGYVKSWLIPNDGRGNSVPVTYRIKKDVIITKWLQMVMPMKDRKCIRNCEWERCAG
jgi:hypothetical protein